MPDIILTLGGFTFQDTEVPERVQFGGDQSLSVKKLVGGKKDVQALGAYDGPIEWNGLSRGPDALDRMQYLDSLRIDGKDLTFTLGQLSYLVKIQEFKFDFERFYQIRYRIRCEVIQNNTAAVNSIPDSNLNDAINGDMSDAAGLVSELGDPTTTSLFGTLQETMNGISSFVNATQATIASVMQPLSAIQGQLGNIMNSADSSISGLGSIGAIGTNVGENILSMADYIGQQSILSQLSGTVGRIEGNLGSVYGSAKQLVTAGGNLYQIASEEYGDTSAWTMLAAANNLSDPILDGINTLTIPKESGGN